MHTYASARAPPNVYHLKMQMFYSNSFIYTHCKITAHAYTQTIICAKSLDVNDKPCTITCNMKIHFTRYDN